MAPQDVLEIINELARDGIHELSTERQRPLEPPFYDVDRNGSIGVNDVLQVINYLYHHGITEVEGESGSALASFALLLQPDSLIGRIMFDGAEQIDDIGDTTKPEPTQEIELPTGLPPRVFDDLPLWRDADVDWTAEDLEEILAELTSGLVSEVDL